MIDDFRIQLQNVCFLDKQTCELRFGSIGLDPSQVRFGIVNFDEILFESFSFFFFLRFRLVCNSEFNGTVRLCKIRYMVIVRCASRNAYSSITGTTLYSSYRDRVFYEYEKTKKEIKLFVMIFPFQLAIGRYSLFYTINLVIPTLMISVLTITLFCLPSDAAEKMMLCTSILVALVFFMLLISKILPSTSLSIPLISKYLMFTFIMNLSSVFLSTLSLYLNHHHTSTLTPVPHWMKIIFLHTLPTCLFLNKPYEYVQKRQRRLTSLTSPLVFRKVKHNQPDLPDEINCLIEKFLELADDIKYLSKKIQGDTEEMKVRKKTTTIIFIISDYLLLLS